MMLKDNASTLFFSSSCQSWKPGIPSTRCHQENSKGEIMDWRPNDRQCKFRGFGNQQKRNFKIRNSILLVGGGGEEYFLEIDREV